MTKIVTVCFAKTPGLTPAKTRLARDIGEVRCNALYILMVKRCRELMMQLTKFHTYVAINEREAITSPYWQGINTYVQTEGGLGEKLSHAENFFFQNFKQIIFWGTDSPALTIGHFSQVKEALTMKNAVIIPALDGGFALYGANSKLPVGSWNKIHYSTSSTCHELQSHLGSDVFLTPMISDLDTYVDIESVIREMDEFSSQGPDWDALCTFLKTL